MATKLGDAYLQLRIRENLAMQMAHLRSRWTEAIRHMQTMAMLTPNLNVQKFNEQLRHLNAVFAQQMAQLQNQANQQLRFQGLQSWVKEQEKAMARQVAMMKAFSQNARMGFAIVGAAAVGVMTMAVRSLGHELETLISRGLQTNMMLERQAIVMEQLASSAFRARAILSELVTLDLRTPFNIKELSAAATALMATGAIGEREVLPMVEKLADAAAGSAQGLSALPHIVRAISQMFAKGKIQAQEMTVQLANAGIPAWKLLADAMGMTVAEVQELGAEGKLGFKEMNLLIDAMGEKYKGLAAKLGKSLEGQLGILRSRIDLIMSFITKPLAAAIGDVLGGISTFLGSEAFSKIQSVLTKVMEAVGNIIRFLTGSPIGQAVTAFTAIAGTMGMITAGITGLLAFLIAFPPAGAAVLAAIGAIIAAGPAILAVAATWTTIGASLIAAWKHSQTFRDTVQEISKLVVDIGHAVWDILVAGFKAALDIAKEFFGAETNAQLWEMIASGIRSMLEEVSILVIQMKHLFDKLHDNVKQIVQRIKNSPMGRLLEAQQKQQATIDTMTGLARATMGVSNSARDHAIAERDRARALRESASAATELAKALKLGDVADDIKKRMGSTTSTPLLNRITGGLGAGFDSMYALFVEEAARVASSRGSGRMLGGLLGRAGGLVGGNPLAGSGLTGMLSGVLAGRGAIGKFFTMDRSEGEQKKFEALQKQAEQFKQSLPTMMKILGGNMVRVKDRLAPEALGFQFGRFVKNAPGKMAGAIMPMFDGDSRKPAAEFSGIAELSKRIQLGLLNSDEKQDRKKMVKHLGAIDKGVAAMGGAIVDAAKWIGKAL